MSNATGVYTVVVNGEKFKVEVAEGEGEIVVKEAAAAPQPAPEAEVPAENAPGMTEVKAQVPGNVWKIIKNPGDSVEEGEVIMILEAMKMEIDVPSPKSGTIAKINVATNQAVQEGQVLALVE